MDATLVNPFIEGTLHILSTTALVKVKPEEPYIKKNKQANGDITGVLEIGGDLSGSAAVSFTEASILGIVSTMFGEEMAEINDEITDAVGEISNMIAGHVTTKIAEGGKQVKVKFSKVMTGSETEIQHADETSPVLVLPFRTTQGRVVVEVCYPE
ncbi:MAG: chemotaxis protein CheX [Desulfobacterales bacterium]|nr:chemotaxis protein CheX [Desulfobacterales bacterium]